MIHSTKRNASDYYYSFKTATIVEPQPFSAKLMFVTGFIVNMVLFTCYGGVLVSILTTMKPRLPFRDFEELQKRPDWNLGVRTNTALADFLAVISSVFFLLFKTLGEIS